MRATIRGLGWLLTPVVVWGASLAGFSIGARLAAAIGSTAWAVGVAVGLAGVAGIATLIWWVSSLQRLSREARGGALRQAGRKQPAESAESEEGRGDERPATVVSLHEAAD